MSGIRRPDYRLKQKLLYIDQTNPNALRNYGDLFLQEGFLSDALDFYQKAGDSESLENIRMSAIENGDVMLFGQAARALGLELKPADWEKVGQKAAELKKYSFARHAFQKANNDALLASLTTITQKEIGGKVA